MTLFRIQKGFFCICTQVQVVCRKGQRKQIDGERQAQRMRLPRGSGHPDWFVEQCWRPDRLGKWANFENMLSESMRERGMEREREGKRKRFPITRSIKERPVWALIKKRFNKKILRKEQIVSAKYNGERLFTTWKHVKRLWRSKCTVVPWDEFVFF